MEKYDPLTCSTRSKGACISGYPKEYSLLSASPLFSGIAPEDFPGMLSCLHAFTRKFPRNSPILPAGTPARSIGILLEGTAHIIVSDVFGNQTIVNALEPPDIFGEAFCCAGSAVLPVSVLAAADSKVLFLDYQKILSGTAPCPFHSILIENMIRVLAQKNILLNQKLRFLSRRSTREKLLAYLSAAAQQSGSLDFTIPFDRQGLADYLCLDRSAMSAELSRMQKDGLITYRKNRFRLNPSSGLAPEDFPN